MFLRKDVLKLCSKFTEEHPSRSVILIKLLCNFIEITLRRGRSLVNLLHIFRTHIPRNTLEGCFCILQQNSGTYWNKLKHSTKWFNPFVPISLFLYPLKTSENRNTAHQSSGIFPRYWLQNPTAFPSHSHTCKHLNEQISEKSTFRTCTMQRVFKKTNGKYCPRLKAY